VVKSAGIVVVLSVGVCAGGGLMRRLFTLTLRSLTLRSSSSSPLFPPLYKARRALSVLEPAPNVLGTPGGCTRVCVGFIEESGSGDSAVGELEFGIEGNPKAVRSVGICCLEKLRWVW